ncbi:hypothetical protein PCANC_13257 [Puccinia coronata f. sp. avenae]|uniref:Nuclear speckle splicing regulatory protein 1 N-terminal domain-containing protein n=1 Tax=Puccinia coronata f. sp. avenae TaxID=200324 RepID=A0A2N5S9Q7_9BASI|nr:hypothetical protein PCANC_21888 [Puccinia coronata f. sp. avenae]PLW43548.1 hypothetical protein PCANC_13257 [Puccinia coronata f. sp. avenae]PLW48531.1 hypothetical protein PCASD_04239 [Puccinia coronata f. sp. avenae]
MSSSIKFSLSTSSKHPSTASLSATSKLSTGKKKSKSVLNQFNDDGDSDEQEGANKLQSNEKKKSNPMAPLVPISSSKLSRQQKLAQEEATKLDSTVFEYDQVYDLMKLAGNKAKLEKDQEGAERKPQYISGLIETAKQRKIDRVRAEDKMVQREREMEGEEFVDKDEFVTPAYLQQQKELREAEEAEKLKAEKAPNKQAMTTFYQNILEEDSKRHEAAVQAVAAAAAAKKPSSGISLGLTATLSSVKSDATNPGQNAPPQYDPEPEAVPSEAKLAAEIEQKLGRKVDLDDEGRIVDHRQLLTGGLNLGPPKLVGPQKPKKMGFALPISERRAQEEREKLEKQAAEKSREEEEEEGGLTQAEKIKLSRERQSALLQQQLIELESNKRKAEEDSRLENLKKVARRNDESKIELLKQQALNRRRDRQIALKQAEDQALPS